MPAFKTSSATASPRTQHKPSKPNELLLIQPTVHRAVTAQMVSESANPASGTFYTCDWLLAYCCLSRSWNSFL
jgi:hypothetical protein